MRTPASNCPHCGYLVDAAMGVSAKGNGSKPRLPVEGDVTVCMSCEAVLTYDANLHVLAITDPKLTKELTTDPLIRRVQREVLDMRTRNPRPV